MRIDVAILRIIKDTLEKQNKYTCGGSGVNRIYQMIPIYQGVSFQLGQVHVHLLQDNFNKAMKAIKDNKRKIKMIPRNESPTKVGIFKEELTFPLSDYIKLETTNFLRQKIPHNQPPIFPQDDLHNIVISPTYP